jgi:hypothetical protein
VRTDPWQLRSGLVAAILLAASAGPRTLSPQLELARALLVTVVVGAIGLRLGDLIDRAPDRAGRALHAAVLGMAVASLWAIVLGCLTALAFRPFATGMAGLLAVLAPSGQRRLRRADADSRVRALLAVGVLVLAVAVGIVFQDIAHERYRPAGAHFYDDVSYHLPAAVTWLQWGDLRMPRLPVGDPSTCFYPIGGELASWMWLAPFSGSDVLARWSQLPAAVILLLAAWVASRRLGSGSWPAAVAVLVPLTIPRLFPEGALSAGNDLWLAAWTVVSFAQILRFAARPSFGRAIVLGAALGLLVGTKYLALLALPWLALAGIGAFRGRACLAPGSLELRQVARGLLLCAAVAAAVGGFSYLRNLVVTGNPVFPQAIVAAGHVVLPGWKEAGLAYRYEAEGRGFDLGAFVAGHREALGPLAGWLLLPAVVLLPLGSLLSFRRLRRHAWPTLAAALAPAWYFVAFAQWIPDHRDVRYLFAAPVFAAIGVARLLSLVPPKVRHVTLGTVLSGVIVAAFLARCGVEARAILAAVLAVVVLAALRLRRAPAGVAFAALALIFVAMAPATLAEYSRRRLGGEPLARRLQEMAPKSDPVAYVGGNRPYFFYGDRLERRVEVVPSGETPDVRFYDWSSKSVSGRPFEGGSRLRWIRNLGMLGCRWVIVEAGPDTEPMERWMRGSPSRFHRRVEIAAGEIWKVRVARRSPPGLSGRD